MSAPDQLTPEDRDALRGRLAELRQAEAEQTERLKPLCAESDRVGIERLPWSALIEMAARAEMLRRIHEQIAKGCAALGVPYDPNAAATH